MNLGSKLTFACLSPLLPQPHLVLIAVQQFFPFLLFCSTFLEIDYIPVYICLSLKSMLSSLIYIFVLITTSHCLNCVTLYFVIPCRINYNITFL